MSDSLSCHRMKNVTLTYITLFLFNPFNRENFIHIYFISSSFYLTLRKTKCISSPFYFITLSLTISGNTMPEDTKFYWYRSTLCMNNFVRKNVIAHRIHYQISCSKFCISATNCYFYVVSSVLVLVVIGSIMLVRGL